MHENPKGMATQTHEIAKRLRIAVPKRKVVSGAGGPAERRSRRPEKLRKKH